MKSNSVWDEGHSDEKHISGEKFQDTKLSRREACGTCLYWMTVGLLIGGIGLAVILTIYINGQRTEATANDTTTVTVITNGSMALSSSSILTSPASTTVITPSNSVSTVGTTSATVVTTTSTTAATVSTIATTMSTIATTVLTTATVAPPLSTTGILFSVKNPHSSNYPTYDYYAYTWMATNSSATLSIFYRHDPGYWMLDDVEVYHGTTQLITNGGFETGDLSNWTYSGTCTSNYGSVTNDSSYAVTGNYYYKDGCTQYGDTISQSFSTTPGDTYVISFWQTNNQCCSRTEIANITIM